MLPLPSNLRFIALVSSAALSLSFPSARADSLEDTQRPKAASDTVAVVVAASKEQENNASAQTAEDPNADTEEKRRATLRRKQLEFASDLGNDIYIASGVLLPLLDRRDNSNEQAYRTAIALSVSTTLAQGLKKIIGRKRPLTDSRTSFPSGHATAAFAVATTASAYQPNRKWAWYLGAILISESRVPLRAHYADDVIVGAALGYVTARWLLPSSAGEKPSSRLRSATNMPSLFVPLTQPRNLSQRHNLSIAPFVEATSGNYGLMLIKPF